VFCEAGGENQPRLIKVGVDSPTKKRWGVFQNPYEGNLLKPPRFRDLGYVSAQVAFVCGCKVYQIFSCLDVSLQHVDIAWSFTRVC
jgi:hypothetical protein